MPLISCPHCEQKVSVTISQAGAETICPACSAAVPVPKLGELRRLEAEVAANQPQTSGAVSARSSESNHGKRVVFALLLAMAGVGLLASTFAFIRYYAVEVVATTEMHLAEVEATYLQVPPAQLVREFQNMEKFGLAATAPYEYKKQSKEKEKWGRITLLCAGATLSLAAIAVLLAVIDSPGRPRKEAV